MIGDQAEALRDVFRGRVHARGDDGYDAARRPWQLTIDPHPALVIQAAGPEDVQAAIRTARERDLPLAVQATGHGAVRRADGGLLLNTSAMNGVAAGTPWSAVIDAAAPHGLAPLSGTSPTVGVVGYTLGGGTGWLSRKYGYAADSVLRAEVVTADGDVVTATAEEHPDLFWALRGGGGNFGVVTELEFRLHPVERIYGGVAMFAADRTADALAVYREWAPDEPDESNTALLAMTVPPVPSFPEAVRGRRVLMLRAVYIGGVEEAERALAPLRQAAGEPLMDGFREMAYPETATLGPPPAPMAAATRCELFDELTDEVIGVALGANGLVAGVEFRHWGGAPARPGAGAGPVGHRHVPFSVAIGAMSPDPAQGPAIQAAVDKAADRLAPHATGGTWLNFLADPARTPAAYTSEDYARLRAVKREYDPDNFFGSNLNIPPAA